MISFKFFIKKLQEAEEYKGSHGAPKDKDPANARRAKQRLKDKEYRE